MRLYVLIAVVFFFVVYAWKDWFVSLCALVVMSVLMQHPDMPRNYLGIPGGNLWNFLLFGVLIAWGARRVMLGVETPTPRAYVGVVLAYAGALLLAFVQGMLDLNPNAVPVSEGPLTDAGSFLIDYLINPLKYLIVAVLMFDGIRSRRELKMAIGAIIMNATLLGLMALRYVPLSSLMEMGSSNAGVSPFRYRFQKAIGIHANDAALVLVAAFWATLAVLPVLKRMKWPWLLSGLAASAVMAAGIALTNSRAGYMATVLLGVLFGALRWRKLLAAVPVAALIAFIAVPGIGNRISVGLGAQDHTGMVGNNMNDITAGRTTNLWPPTIEEIQAHPVLGQGRLTIQRTSLYYRILEREGSCPSHPHNAYLEVLLDSGVVGLAGVVSLFFVLPILAYLRRVRQDPLLNSAIYVGIAGVGAIALMGLTGQSFWPREGVDVVLYTIAIALGADRIGLHRTAARARPQPEPARFPAPRSGRPGIRPGSAAPALHHAVKRPRRRSGQLAQSAGQTPAQQASSRREE